MKLKELVHNALTGNWQVSKMDKKKIFILAITLSIFLLITSYFIISTKDTHISNTEIISLNNEVIDGEEVLPSEEQTSRLIHRMTHPVTIAKKKWYKDILPTPENVDYVINLIEQSEFAFLKTNTQILGILYEFKEGNFDNAVTLHNIIWENANGVIGKAEKLNVKMIERLQREYYNINKRKG